MRRITLTIVSTIAILVLLFAYKTSRNESVGTAAVTAANGTSGGAHIVGAPTSSSSSDTGSDSITVPTTDSSTAGTSTTVSSTTTSTTRSSKSAHPSTSTSASSTSAKSTPSTTSSKTSTTSTSSTTSKSATPVVIDGGSIDTRYGPVQVEVTITNGKITNVTVPVYPQDSGRDQEINSQAIPILQQEVLSAQGAQIDAVSGATYTSDGFVSSLQSALDAAHFGQ